MDEPPRSWSPGRSTRSVACRSRSPHPQGSAPGSPSDRSSHKGSRGLATGRRKKLEPPLPAGAPSRTDRAHCSGRIVGSPWRTAISPESKSAAERGGHCIGRAPRFVNSSTLLGSAGSTARAAPCSSGDSSSSNGSQRSPPSGLWKRRVWSRWECSGLLAL